MKILTEMKSLVMSMDSYSKRFEAKQWFVTGRVLFLPHRGNLIRLWQVGAMGYFDHRLGQLSIAEKHHPPRLSSVGLVKP